MRAVSTVVIHLLCATLCVALSSCEFGANAVDGSELVANEGSVFFYDNFTGFNSRTFEQLGPSIEIRLLSKEASIGGRDGVLGFVSSADGELIFTDVRDGEIWHYFTAAPDFERPKHRTGEWIRLPHEGEDPVFATVDDSIVSFDPEFPTPITRELTVRPAGDTRFYVDGFYFNARKVTVTSSYSSRFGEAAGEDVQELTFIEGLGVLAEKVTRAQFGETTHFIMSEIQLK